MPWPLSEGGANPHQFAVSLTDRLFQRSAILNNKGIDQVTKHVPETKKFYTLIINRTAGYILIMLQDNVILLWNKKCKTE